MWLNLLWYQRVVESNKCPGCTLYEISATLHMKYAKLEHHFHTAIYFMNCFVLTLALFFHIDYARLERNEKIKSRWDNFTFHMIWIEFGKGLCSPVVLFCKKITRFSDDSYIHEVGILSKIVCNSAVTGWSLLPYGFVSNWLMAPLQMAEQITRKRPSV